MPKNNERVTYKTLSLAIEAMRKEIKGDLSAVQDQISNLSERIENTYVTQKELASLIDDVRGLQDNQRWVVITVVGTVLVAILAMVLKPQLM